MHISFDFDYTLADSSKGAIICANYALESMGRPQRDDIEIEKTIGLSLSETYRQLTGEQNLNDISRFTTLFLQKADEVVVDCITFFDETRNALLELKEEGHFISIVSTKYTKRINAALERDGLLSLVDLVVGGDSVNEAKPSPEGINRAVGISKVTKDETIYVGDSKSDGLAAEAAGVSFVGILTGKTPESQLREYRPIEVIVNLTELRDVVKNIRSTTKIEQSQAMDAIKTAPLL